MELKADMSEQLLEIARNKFGQLNATHESLYCSAFKREIVNYSSDSEELNDPIRAAEWGEERTLQADQITWLCTDPNASALLSPRGLQIEGAKIEGQLDLQFTTINMPLYFANCFFSEPVLLKQAKLLGLSLKGTHVVSIDASYLEVEGDILLDEGFKAEGEVHLLGTTIGGDLDCDDGQFLNKDGCALCTDGTKVEGNVSLRNGFKAEGEVRLFGASIGGDLDCDDGQFLNKDGCALSTEGAKVEGNVFLRNGFKAEGKVCLLGTTIGGDLDCNDGQFLNKDGCALRAERAKINGSVFLDERFKTEGEVRLLGTTIGGDLDCCGGQFLNKDGYALIVERAKINGSVFLRNGFKAEGGVRLFGTTIGGILECDDGQFLNKDGCALSTDGAKIERDVFLRNGFKAEGEVRLLGTTIGGDLDCCGGQFLNKDGCALSTEGAKVEGNVFLRNGFKAEGKVDLYRATVRDHLVFKNVDNPEEITLNLNYTEVGTLSDEEASWPGEKKLHLNGFIYNAIATNSPLDYKTRLRWIRYQPRESFSLQPYEQLAKVMKEGGHERAAKQVLIAKHQDLRQLGDLTFWGKLKNLLFGAVIAHGYKPHQALWLAFVWIFIGVFIFSFGYSSKLFSPSKVAPYAPITSSRMSGVADDYPTFNAFVYSLDAFIPIVNLHQQNYWLPDANKGKSITILWIKTRWGSLLRYYLWLHISLGWILTSLWVAGFTGLVKRT
jgi:sRNA-binding regulator protein Hfq